MLQLSLFDSSASTSRDPDAYGHVLSPEQALVRDAGAGHMVVVAGAGTGKTELLTQRVLKLLLEGAPEEEVAPAELEGVVALTFTNKAASEMRSRVYRALVRRLRMATNAAERARLSELRSHFSANNRIWTFDSLGATLLRLFPEHSPLPRGARQPTAGQERALMRSLGRAFWAWAEQFDEDEAERLFDCLECFDRRENALAAIRSAAKRERAALERLANEPSFSGFADEMLSLAQARLDALWQAHSAHVEALGDLAPRHRTLLLDQSAVFLPAKSGGFLISKSFSTAFARDFGPTVSPRDQKLLADRLLEWKSASEELGERRGSLELCDENGEGDPSWEREWRGRRSVAALSRYALWWRDEERLLKDGKGLADFDDITRAALEVLEVPEVAHTLRGEIEWLLVDEFQDTNPSQWRIVEGLRRHAPQSGNTLVVGDPKQAIYDFRGGDIRVFDRGRETLEREGALSSQLSISRRSAPPLVEWTNRAFASIFPLDGAPRERFEAAHGPLAPVEEAWQTPRAPGDEPGVLLLRPSTWRAPDAPPPPAKPLTEFLRVEAANALASWLLQLQSDAQEWRDDEPNAADKLRQKSFASVSRAMAKKEPAVAVLFGDNSVKAVFEAVLRVRGVAFVSVRGRGFFRSDAVRWSVALWRALLDEDDEAAWVGLLRSPLGGQSDVSLLERHVARESGANWTPLDELDAATKLALEERMKAWRALASALPVSLVMERVLEESEIAWFEAKGDDTAQRIENWRKVLDLVREREDENEGGLRALVDFFEAHADDDSEPLAPLPSGGSVQLMTVHSSKGLGFPCCVLAQLESAKREGSDKTLLWGELNGQVTAAFSFGREREDEATGRDKAPPPLLFDLLKHGATARALAEWKRLFYVACTRAQSHLVLLETDANAPATSWHALARPALNGLNEVLPGVEAATVFSSTLSAPDEFTIAYPVALEPPAPLAIEAAREKRFDELWGEDADLSLSAQRTWIENRLRERGGDAALLRQDVPFGARGSLFGLPNEWLVGLWPWLAPLPGGGFLLVVTGQTSEAALHRAGAMRLIAQEARLEIEECFALWKGEAGEVEAVGVPVR